ncbi:hypothetical protein GH714_033870 [Hevea brasiliensis]|uniref:Disease resistance N-terminal domain-containing protein n=1 Tax=Hevea brasiliensis TaxID=3981 RepID=A0A6A6L6R1_HEVBR|nr:hypothetical protein GH714_033870 [Hevea brasiliensis]
MIGRTCPSIDPFLVRCGIEKPLSTSVPLRPDILPHPILATPLSPSAPCLPRSRWGTWRDSNRLGPCSDTTLSRDGSSSPVRHLGPPWPRPSGQPLPIWQARISPYIKHLRGELVGGAFLSAFLQSLFDRMASREVIDFFNCRRLNDQLLKKLDATLNSVNGLLDDAEEKQITVEAVRNWLDNI